MLNNSTGHLFQDLVWISKEEDLFQTEFASLVKEIHSTFMAYTTYACLWKFEPNYHFFDTGSIEKIE